MKRLLITILALSALSSAVYAQDNFAGIRLGYGAAFTTELSAQRYMGDITRIEVDLGLRYRDRYGDRENPSYYPIGLILGGSYQWHWFLLGGLGAYAGPAIQFSLPGWSRFGLGIGGQLGVDYQFNVPFQVFIDWRPLYLPFGPYKGFDPNGAVGIRYNF